MEIGRLDGMCQVYLVILKSKNLPLKEFVAIFYLAGMHPDVFMIVNMMVLVNRRLSMIKYLIRNCMVILQFLIVLNFVFSCRNNENSTSSSARLYNDEIE